MTDVSPGYEGATSGSTTPSCTRATPADERELPPLARTMAKDADVPGRAAMSLAVWPTVSGRVRRTDRSATSTSVTW